MLTNKVSAKPIIQIDIEQWIPKETDIVFIDLKDYLFKGLIIKEEEFRKQIDEKDWTEYKNKYTVVQVSNQAIIPQWAYLIIANKLSEVQSPCFIHTQNYKEVILSHIIQNKDYSEYKGKRLLVKGCSREKLSQQPFVLLTQKLTPIVKSLSYGESCSTVPVFKY